MIRTAIWGALVLAVAGAGAYIVWTGVMMHYVRIDNTMRWECVRDAQNVAPGGQTVRLTFVDSPSFVDTISGRALCDRAARNGRPVVRVTFIAWGNRYRGLAGGLPGGRDRWQLNRIRERTGRVG